MFAKLSKEKELRSIQLDNLFITEYMPFAPENYVKVYIAGLSMAYSSDNDLDKLSSLLGMNKSIIMDAFEYWHAQGIVNILSTEPPEIEYSSVKPLSAQIKKYSKAKYETFNNQLHAMLPHRSFLPSEYNEYYSIMESLHIDIDAMLAIIAYCVRYKGDDISYTYILAVARNLAHEGATNFERVNEKLNELSLYQDELNAILKALGSKKTPDHNDSRLYVKWTKTLGFTPEVIIHVAKELKKGGIERLDLRLTKYYENHVYSLEEIKAYNENRDKMFALTKEINRILGIYIEQLDYTIETYISKWCSFGFSDSALIMIAKYCYARDMRTLSAMDENVKKFYRQGLLTESAINSLINETASISENISRILSIAGLNRNVNSWDRDYYRTWTYTWGFTLDIIEYAASLAVGKGNVCAYINKVLASWREKKVTSLEEAKKCSFSSAEAETAATVTNKSAEELNALFAHIDPEEI